MSKCTFTRVVLTSLGGLDDLGLLAVGERLAGGGRPGAPIALPRFLPMVRPPPPSSPAPPGRRCQGARPSVPCPRSGAYHPPAGPSCAPTAAGAARSRALLGPSFAMACGSTCTVASRLIKRPSAAGEPAHGAPLPPRTPGLEAPADPAGRAHPGDRARHGPAEQGRH